MTESGGPTTQSGILYQNSVAALYLGQLCNTASRPDSEFVVFVRFETIDHVDDIVVTFADKHKEYVQAKENVSSGDSAWNKVWSDFDKQFHSAEFQAGQDRLVFQIGTLRNEHETLHGLCERAFTSPNYQKWYDRLNEEQKSLLLKITALLPPELSIKNNLLEFFRSITIKTEPREHIERDLVPVRMPQSTKSPQELFRLLRDRVGGQSRIRGQFDANSLRSSLQSESKDLQFVLPADIENLRKTFLTCGAILKQHKSTIGNTGKHFPRLIVNELLEWLCESADDQKNVSMLLDQAGTGKTVILRDVLLALEEKSVTTLAIKADQQLVDINLFSDIQAGLGFPQSVESATERLAKLGRVVVLIDQIDALLLSLAHDQKALNMALDLVARLRQIPNVRILISCRTFDREGDPRLKRIEVGKEFKISELSNDDVNDVLEGVGINPNDLSESTKYLLHTPLHLDLFVWALGSGAKQIKEIRGITSLQELYLLIWQNVVLLDEPNAPSVPDRVAVINSITDYMDRVQRISAPQSLFQTPETQSLAKAANWLASVGILISTRTEWTL